MHAILTQSFLESSERRTETCHNNFDPVSQRSEIHKTRTQHACHQPMHTSQKCSFENVIKLKEFYI